MATVKSEDKPGMFETPGGNVRNISSVHGALLCEDVIVLLGADSQNIDFKKYDEASEASTIFNELKDNIKYMAKLAKNSFIELPNGNLVREKQIMAIELITNGYHGFIIRNGDDAIVDFLSLATEEHREIVKVELLKALEPKSVGKKYKPDWSTLLNSKVA